MILNGICCLCVRHGCSVTQVGGAGEREQAMCNAKGKSRLSRRRLFAWALPTQLNSPMRVKPSAHYGHTPQTAPPFAAGYTRFFVPHIPSLSPIETTPDSAQHVRLSSRATLQRVGGRQLGYTPKRSCWYDRTPRSSTRSSKLKVSAWSGMPVPVPSRKNTPGR